MTEIHPNFVSDSERRLLLLSRLLQVSESFRSNPLLRFACFCFGALRAFKVVPDIDSEIRRVLAGKAQMAPVSQHSKKTISTLTAEILVWRDTRVKFASYALVPLRLIIGFGFLAHGLAKWSKGPEAFANILHETGVSLPNLIAWLTIAAEIVVGVAFLIGAFVSLVSIPAIILLAVAIFTVHLPYGFSSIKLLSVNNGRAQFGPPGYECDLLYIVCIVALALSGPTPWSVEKHRSLLSSPQVVEQLNGGLS